MKFIDYKSGLYYYDTSITKSTKQSVKVHSFINTIENNHCRKP